jgi:hypothetical protein
MAVTPVLVVLSTTTARQSVASFKSSATARILRSTARGSIDQRPSSTFQTIASTAGPSIGAIVVAPSRPVLFPVVSTRRIIGVASKIRSRCGKASPSPGLSFFLLHLECLGFAVQLSLHVFHCSYSVPPVEQYSRCPKANRHDCRIFLALGWSQRRPTGAVQ